MKRYIIESALVASFGLALLAAGTGLAEATPVAPAVSTNASVIEVGRRRASHHIGFGWSGREHQGAMRFRWIQHLEADLKFKVKAVTDLEVTFTAAPFYVSWRRQSVGAYVNGCFVTEWVCPDDPAFQEYQMVVPARLLKPGRNTLTLRMAYRRRASARDRRQLALAVQKVELRPR
ncbi:MAG: hypothetical protein V1873_06165 [Verrucomicrobiota bacterium]